MPPEVSDEVIDYVDLDIDLIVWPNGRLEILDMEEFEENAAAYGYSHDVKARALETLRELTVLHEQSSFLEYL